VSACEIGCAFLCEFVSVCVRVRVCVCVCAWACVMLPIKSFVEIFFFLSF